MDQNMATFESSPSATSFHREVAARLGVLPNFLCLADAAPACVEALWGFARSAYLASPLPPVFKERLFVHLSRFCPVRYCIVRHAGFLMGLGWPAGDAQATPATPEEVVALLSVPVPGSHEIKQAFTRLETAAPIASLPLAGSSLENDLFAALTAVFIDPSRAAAAKSAVHHVLGDRTFELVIAYLSYIRTEHFWTESHADIQVESDVIAMMRRHPDLAKLLLDGADVQRGQDCFLMQETFADLRASLQAKEARDAFLLRLSDALRPLSDPSEVKFAAAQALGKHLDVNRCFYVEALQNEDTLQGAQGYWDAVAPMPMNFQISDFDPALLDLFRKRKTLVLKDAQAGASSTAVLEGFRNMQIAAAVAVPLVKEGKLVAILSLHQAIPRDWSDSEVRLTEEVAERTWAAVERARAEAELRASKNCLMESDRRKDEFLATLAHELRNPLAPIRNALHLLKVAPDGVSVDRVHAMLDRQMKHVVRLLDELLDVSRISRGVVELQRRRLNLANVLNDAIESTRELFSQKGHTVDISAQGVVLVEGDAMRLSQVLSNLLNNAARYTDAGGRIAIDLRRNDSEALVSVQDSGIGIAQSDLHRVFKMFGQLQPGHLRSQGGLGLGLALAKQLAELHGGTIEVKSEGPSRGSCFTLRLPLAVDAVETKESEGDTPTVPTGRLRKRVLVVDDHRDVVDSTKMLLEHMGAETRVAYDGASGIAEAKAWHPDIVLLDLGMPDLDGYTAARQLRDIPNGKSLVLVAVTGWGQKEDRERTRAAGFDFHIVKPLDPTVIQTILISL